MTTQQQFLYRLTLARPTMLIEGLTPEEQLAVDAHFAYLVTLRDSGLLILAGRTQTSDDRTFGVTIFTAESEVAAHAIMENDPAVRAGVMHAELFPFRVAVSNALTQVP